MHLYFLKKLNCVDAALVFIYFTGDDTVPGREPVSREGWQTAIDSRTIISVYAPMPRGFATTSQTYSSTSPTSNMSHGHSLQNGDSLMAFENGTRILITGAAGFGGSSLARALLSQGHGVTGLDVVAPGHAGLLRRELSDPGFHYLWKSIQDIQPGDVDGHSVVVHLAAQPDARLAFESPRYTVMQNIEGTVALLEAVRHVDGVSKLMFAGSGPVPADRRGAPPDPSQSVRVLEGDGRAADTWSALPPLQVCE